MDIAANIRAHRATPELSLDRYVKSRVVELGQSLDSRTAIYLDTNFWITLEKVVRGRSNEEADGELLFRLRRLTAAGRVFCPISESIFMELMKQTDATSRLAMTRLIDELSHGVTLIAYDMRIGTELAHFLRRFAENRDDLHPLHHLVWSKIACVLGFGPALLPCDAAREPAVQKAFFDLMWGMTLEAWSRTRTMWRHLPTWISATLRPI
jgi:predicted DNA-binding ribbon-helix-helix protein